MTKFVFTDMSADPQDQEFDTFEGAFLAMYNQIHKMVNAGEATFQWLETCIWIETFVDGKTIGPAFWYDVRDLAFEQGIIDAEGKLV